MGLVVVGILSAMMLGAVSAARDSARASATKSTIAKLHVILMARYESYMTRRVPVEIESPPAGYTEAQKALWSKANYRKRLDAIRDTMRMEMPDSATDISDPQYEYTFEGDSSKWKVEPEPALYLAYKTDPVQATSSHPSAECLYKIVSMGDPEAMEQFQPSEIGSVTDSSGNQKPVFIDGWGRPIMWFRAAPGFTAVSEIQTGDDHDPFDIHNVDADAVRLIPLVYSAGPDGLYGLDRVGGNPGYTWHNCGGDPFETQYAAKRGTPCDEEVNGKTILGTHRDNITNHNLEAR